MGGFKGWVVAITFGLAYCAAWMVAMWIFFMICTWFGGDGSWPEWF